MKNKISKKRINLQTELQSDVFEMWQDFNRSVEDRQYILDGFDQAVSRFSHKPHIADYFKKLKAAFLESEGH